MIGRIQRRVAQAGGLRIGRLSAGCDRRNRLSHQEVVLARGEFKIV
jgi:hypothetical protein